MLIDEQTPVLFPLTLRRIAAFLGIGLPESALPIADHEFAKAAAAWSMAAPNVVHFGKPRKAVDAAVADGVVAFVDDEQRYLSTGEPVPTLIQRRPREAYVRLMRAIRDQYDVKTIAVTGSNGKTTTREMIRLVTSEQFTTHWSRGNSNVFGRVGDTVQRLRQEHEVYVQETGAVEPGIIDQAARMIAPDAGLITNIGVSHIGEYGGEQRNVLYDKLSIDRRLGDDGVMFVNFDDPILRVHTYQHRVVSYGLDEPGVDYTAEGLHEDGGAVHFTVVERATGARTAAKIHVVGRHNVGNAVAAFAIARWLGMEPAKITAGLAKYRTTGTRQNLLLLGGHKVLVDCFNATEIAIRGTAETLASLSRPAGAKRTYVVGDIPRLGEHAEPTHRQVGRELATFHDIDAFYCFGPLSKFVAEELENAGRQVFHTEARAELQHAIELSLGPDDVLAFKAGAPTALGLTIDAIFGTDFLYGDPSYWRSSSCESDGIAYRVIDALGTELRDGTAAERSSVSVGGEAGGAGLVLIGQRAFAGSAVEDVRIEEPVRGIATRAFYQCTSLRSVTLPASLRTINRGAFNGCTSLIDVEISEGLTTIQVGAFRNCTSLRTITLPRSVRTIEPGAFAGNGKLVIRCYKGSPAEAILRTRLRPRQLDVVPD